MIGGLSGHVIAQPERCVSRAGGLFNIISVDRYQGQHCGPGDVVDAACICPRETAVEVYSI